MSAEAREQEEMTLTVPAKRSYVAGRGGKLHIRYVDCVGKIIAYGQPIGEVASLSGGGVEITRSGGDDRWTIEPLDLWHAFEAAMASAAPAYTLEEHSQAMQALHAAEEAREHERHEKETVADGSQALMRHLRGKLRAAEATIASRAWRPIADPPVLEGGHSRRLLGKLASGHHVFCCYTPFYLGHPNQERSLWLCEGTPWGTKPIAWMELP